MISFYLPIEIGSEFILLVYKNIKKIKLNLKQSPYK